MKTQTPKRRWLSVLIAMTMLLSALSPISMFSVNAAAASASETAVAATSDTGTDDTADSGEATEKLKNIAVTEGALSPQFSSDSSSYTIYVAEGTESVSLKTEKFGTATEVSISYDGNNYADDEATPVSDGKTIRVTGTMYTEWGYNSRSYLLTFKVVKAEGRGFDFSLDEESLKVIEDGEHTDGTPYLKVKIPSGTEKIQLERTQAVQALSQDSSVIIEEGLGPVDLATAAYIGKDNYFKVLVGGEKTYYVWLCLAGRNHGCGD